jgi:protease IV
MTLMPSRRLGWWILVLYAVCLAGALIELRTGKPAETRAASILPSNEAIAVVELFGPISLSMDGFGGGVDVETVTRQMQDMRGRSDVKAVLLRINSPGGSVAAVQEIHQHVVALRKAGKVVVASFGDVAASGGYYIAAACDKIVANPGTITGSIGVIFQLGNVRELFRKFGVEVETIKSGDMKDAGSPFRPLGEEERRMFRALVSEAYGQFFSAVAEGRNMKPADRWRTAASLRAPKPRKRDSWTCSEISKPPWKQRKNWPGSARKIRSSSIRPRRWTA